MSEEILHEVTAEEVVENGLEGQVEAGDTVSIPVEDESDGSIIVEDTQAMKEVFPEAPKQKTEEELAAEEPEIDFSNPDATPNKYNLFRAEQIKRVNVMVDKFVDELMATDIPYAFAELSVQILHGKLKIVKGKSKEFDKVNRLDNLANLTPMNKLELYESIEESNEALTDLDD